MTQNHSRESKLSRKNLLSSRSFVSYLLLPSAVDFYFLQSVRRLLYKIGLLKTRRLGAKVISIGNLTTGGTGKTPFTIAIAAKFKSENRSVAILSRGYRSKSQSKSLTFCNAAGPLDFAIVGDEVALMARKARDVWFGVGSVRYKTGSEIERKGRVDVFLLDDGFQHWQLHRDCDIVLIDALNPFGNGFLLPAGRLREPISSLGRASLVVITRSESVNAADLDRLIERIMNEVNREKIFVVRTVIDRIYDFTSGETVAIDVLKGRSLNLFCGIGNPDGFVKLIAASGITPSEITSFRDHHVYTQQEIEALKQNSTRLLTTEKDAVKLQQEWFRAGECYVAEISVAFREDEDIFWQELAEVIRC